MGTLTLFYWLLYKKIRLHGGDLDGNAASKKSPMLQFDKTRTQSHAQPKENTGLNHRQPTLQIRPSALLYYVRNIRICKGENTIVSVNGSSKTIK